MSPVRRTRSTSVAKEIDAIEFEITERTLNFACDFLEDNGFTDAAAALAATVFDNRAQAAVEGKAQMGVAL